MFELAGDLRLTQKALVHFVAFSQLRLQFLDGDFAVELGVNSSHDLPDATAREEPQGVKTTIRTSAARCIRRESGCSLSRCALRRLIQQFIKLKLTLKLSSPLWKSSKELLRRRRLAHRPPRGVLYIDQV